MYEEQINYLIGVLVETADKREMSTNTTLISGLPSLARTHPA